MYLLSKITTEDSFQRLTAAQWKRQYIPIRTKIARRVLDI